MKGITENFSWRNATIFAKASTYAYRDLSEFKREFGSDDGAEVRFYDVAGTQAYSWMEGNNLCFVFRGTEPTQWADIKADLKFRKVKSMNNPAKVHGGFFEAVDHVYGQILETIRTHPKHKLWFCGHSLGAALATLCAGRINRNDIGLYTYGSPRVVTKQYPKYIHFKHRSRFRNNNDIVTRVPPEWLGFQHISAHGGNLIYFDSKGLPHIGFKRGFMFKEWIMGMWRGFTRDRTWDSFSDHDITSYYRLCREKMVEDVAD